MRTPDVTFEPDLLPGANDVSLHAQLAQLERTEAALVLASGMAAVACTMMTLLRPGDHMLASAWLRPYTRLFFEQELPALGVSVSFVDPTETRGWRRAVTRTTRLCYVESPVGPTTRIVDLRPPRTLAHELGVALVVDSTFASPVNFRPIDFGADVVLHSASPFLDGHRDEMAGVVCGTDGVIEEVRNKMQLWGAMPHPQALASLARGLKTLTARATQQNASARAVAEWASQHDAVATVMYPGLTSHPDHATATECLMGFGSVLTMRLSGGREAAHRMLSRLLHVTRCEIDESPRTSAAHVAAVRLAGVDSTASALPTNHGAPDGLIRLHIGLEDASTLIGDLTQAME